MSIAGSLEAYSLPELFRLLDSGSKSGKLVIQTQSDSGASNANNTYYIWFYKGRLVAFTRPEEGDRLIESVESRGWLSDRVLGKLVPLCPEGRPLGTYLKSIGALKEEQLNKLFQVDLDRVLELFELSSGQFQFEVFSDRSQTDILKGMPCLEMTGISLRATEIALLALRQTKNWDRFAEQLPENSSGLQRLFPQPQYRLIPLESELWKHANSITPLDKIAKEVEQSPINIKRAAFCLMISGMVEEVPQATLRSGLVSLRPLPSTTLKPTLAQNQKKQEAKKTIFNTSVLQGFVNFLRKKF